MRYIDYDHVDNPMMGDVYYDEKDACMKIWHNNKWIPFMMTNDNRDRKKELIEEFEKDPELFNDVFNEIRKRKIEKIIK